MKADMLKHNKDFVASEGYKPYITSKYPDKKIAIVTCMDTRLVTLLPAALGIKNGDVKMIKNAGGMVTDPWGDSMRSLLVGIYELGVEEVMIVGHTECGVKGMKAEEFYHLMEKRGINPKVITMMRNYGKNIDQWLTGFEDTPEEVRKSVALVRNHPFMPADVKVEGFIMDSLTGEITPV